MIGGSEDIYADAITCEPLMECIMEAAREAFEEADQITEINACVTRDVVYKDAVTGRHLRGPLVVASCKHELQYFASKKVLEKRPYIEAVTRTGERPITVRWIDAHKCDDEENYRSRLVANEMRKHCERFRFAPTPPLQSAKQRFLSGLERAWHEEARQRSKKRAPHSDILCEYLPRVLLRIDGPKQANLR